MQQKIHLKSLDETCDYPHLHESIKLFLTMNKNSHTREELYYILQRMEELPYFKQFVTEKLSKGTQRNDILELCSRLRMEYFKGGEILFQENDPSNDKLYIIYYGEVMLMRERKMDQLMTTPIQGQEVVKQGSQLNKLNHILAAKKFTAKLLKHYNNQYKEPCISYEEKKKLEEQFGESIRIMGEGNGFGEKALAENIPRTLTVASFSQELFTVVLKKDDFLTYQQTFERTKKEKQQLMFNIFKNVNNEYSSQRLESMIYSCQTISYDRLSQLSVEDEIGDAFYLIISGDVTLYKRQDAKIIPLCIISSGHLFGEEIVINKTNTYEYTGIVTSLQASVIVIDAQEFIHKFPEECMIQLQKDYKKKKINRMNLLRLLTSKQKIDTSNEKLSYESILQLADLDKERKNVKKSFDDNQRRMRFTQNFLSIYTNPSVQNFCIQQIVDREKQLQRQKSFLPKHNSTEPKEFDFGDNSKESVKRTKYLFMNRLNRKKPLQNFLKPNSQVQLLAIKNDLMKSYRSSTKKLFCHSNISIKTYVSPTSSKNSQMFDFRESSTNLFTINDDKQSIKCEIN